MGGTSTTSMGSTGAANTAGSAMDYEAGSSFSSDFGSGFGGGFDTPSTPAPSVANPVVLDINSMQDVGIGKPNRADDVVKVDTELKNNGLDTANDFIGAIKQGQSKLAEETGTNLKPDGWVGPKTREAYKSWVTKKKEQTGTAFGASPLVQKAKPAQPGVSKPITALAGSSSQPLTKPTSPMASQPKKPAMPKPPVQQNKTPQQVQQEKAGKALGNLIVSVQKKKASATLAAPAGQAGAVKPQPSAQTQPKVQAQPAFKALPPVPDDVRQSNVNTVNFVKGRYAGVGDLGKHGGARAVENMGDQGISEVLDLGDQFKRHGMTDRSEALLKDTYANIRDPKLKQRFAEAGNRWHAGEEVFGGPSSNHILKGGSRADDFGSSSQENKPHTIKGLEGIDLEKVYEFESGRSGPDGKPKIYTQGYIPGVNESGKAVNKKSGVTVGHGVDIGQMNSKEINSFNISPELKEKLSPYTEKTGDEAFAYLRENPLDITPEEAQQLTDAKYFQVKNIMANDYDKVHGKGAFDRLPGSVKTVAFSVGMNSGQHMGVSAPKFWGHVKSGNYTGMYQELRNFYSPKSRVPEGLRDRRGREADYLRDLFPQRKQPYERM